MRRKNVTLDFTSLLDVIMIILFVVLANMGASSISAIEEAETATRIAQSQNEMLLSENEILQDSLVEIQNDATDNVAIYESVIDEMTKVNLICETSINPETNFPEVEISIFVNDDSSQKSEEERFVLVHELGLTSSERQILSANQIVKVTEILTSVLETDDSPLFWFMLQYDYEDENITYSDLEILRSAIENIEISFSKPCYIEEISIG